MHRKRLIVVAVAGLVVVAIGYGPTVSDASVTSKRTSKVKVLVSEWLIKPALDFVEEGKAKLVVRNRGNEKHELVVVRADSFTSLPTKADGAVDESKIAKSDKIGEIGNIKPGKTKSKVFRFSAGTYVLLCNIVDKDGDVHFEKGMHASFEAG
jgi:hypothetical protein